MTAQRERADHEWQSDPFTDWIEANMVVTVRRPAPTWRVWLAEAIESCLDWLLGVGMSVTDWLRGQ